MSKLLTRITLADTGQEIDMGWPQGAVIEYGDQAMMAKTARSKIISSIGMQAFNALSIMASFYRIDEQGQPIELVSSGHL